MSSISESKTKAAYAAFQRGEFSTLTAACKAHSVCIKFASPFLRDVLGVRVSRDRFVKRYREMDAAFFSQIDTEVKAYFLGMLSADGSIERDGNRVSWTILDSDASVMYRFLDEVRLPHGLMAEFKVPRSQPMRRLEIYSRRMRDDLLAKGLVPNKSSGIFQPYRDVPVDLLHHYFRGLFDGDGWCSLSGKSPEIGLCNSRAVCEYVKGILDVNGITVGSTVTRNNTTKDNGLYRIRVGSRAKILKLIDRLYADSTVSIERKRVACDAFRQRSTLSI